jgi:predicted RNA-binding Zn-ribbon protein involved in translation (DUF1610 family)
MITKEELKDLVKKCWEVMRSNDHDVRMKTAALALSTSVDRMLILLLEAEIAKSCPKCGAFKVPVDQTMGKETYIFCSNCGSELSRTYTP